MSKKLMKIKEHTQYNFLSQGNDTCCFVYAVANFQIFCGVSLPDLERAKDVAKCRHGSTISSVSVVKYFGAKLRETSNAEDVMNNSGIVNIMHPIVNGHSMFIYPDDDRIVLVNSWLGPITISTSRNRLGQFVRDNLGCHWVSSY